MIDKIKEQKRKNELITKYKEETSTYIDFEALKKKVIKRGIKDEYLKKIIMEDLI